MTVAVNSQKGIERSQGYAKSSHRRLLNSQKGIESYMHPLSLLLAPRIREFPKGNRKARYGCPDGWYLGVGIPKRE